MYEDWTELYRPRTLNEVVGNPKAIKELRAWANAWEAGHPRERAVVLMGPPGIGKTSTALALAQELGWGLVEMNASDQRNAEAIKRVAGRGAMADTFSDTGEYLSSKEGRRKLIVLDEADSIFGREDHGGIPAIAELVRTTRQPIILIANDFYALSRRSSVIKSATLQIKYSRLNSGSIKTVLKRIALDQEVAVEEKVFESIAERSNGDLRAAIRDLQAVAQGQDRVEQKDLTGLGDRLSRKSMYDLMAEVLGGTNPRKARSIMMDTDEEPDYIMKWLDENVPLVYKEPEDLFRAYYSLSRAATFLGRVQRRQYYGFWAYASEHMAYGVTLAKSKPYRGYVQYRFPLMLLRLSRSKEARGVKGSFLAKLGRECHASEKESGESILPYFHTLYQKNREFRIGMTIRLALEQEEIAYLLEQKLDSSMVRHLMEEVERSLQRPTATERLEDEPVEEKKKPGRKKKEIKVEERVEEKPPEVQPAPPEEGEGQGSQKTLFQF